MKVAKKWYLPIALLVVTLLTLGLNWYNSGSPFTDPVVLVLGIALLYLLAAVFYYYSRVAKTKKQIVWIIILIAVLFIGPSKGMHSEHAIINTVINLMNAMSFLMIGYLSAQYGQLNRQKKPD